MTTTWKAVSALTLLGVVAVLLVVSFRQPTKVIGITNSGMHTLNGSYTPPKIHIVGGSITVWSASWNPVPQSNNSPFHYVTQQPVIPNGNKFEIALEKVTTDGSGAPTGWTGVSSWQIKVYAAKGDGSQDSKGLLVGANADNTVTVTPFGDQAGFYDLISNGFPEGYSQHGVRYHYTGTCSVSSSTQLPLCEHLYGMDVKIGDPTYSYTCPDGECSVSIDQSQ